MPADTPAAARVPRESAGVAARFDSILNQLEAQPAVWMAAVAAAFVLQLSPLWYATPDSAVYLSLARSLIQNGHFSALGSPHLAYPPGYPLIASAAFAFGSQPFFVLSIINLVLALCLIGGVYRWSQDQFGRGGAAITLFVLVNATVWYYYRRALSDFAFMAAAIWTAIALNRMLGSRSAREATRNAAIAAVLLAALAMVREAGITFAAGLGLAVAIEAVRGKLAWSRIAGVAAAVAAPAALAIIAFTSYDAAVAQHSPLLLGTHVSGFLDPNVSFFPRLAEGLRLRTSEIARLLIPGMFKTYGHKGQWLNPNMLVFVPVAIAIAVGWWRSLFDNRARAVDVFSATLPFYVGLYIVWGFDADTRYMMPMLPVLAGALWTVMQPLGSRRAMLFGCLIVAHLAVSAGYWISIDLPRAWRCNAQWGIVTGFAEQIGAASVSTTPEVPQCMRLMLTFALDAPVEVESSAPAKWIVAGPGTPACAGCRTAVVQGEYRLMERK